MILARWRAEHSARRLLSLALMLSALIGCGDSSRTGEFYAGLNDGKSGLARTVRANGWAFTMKYLSPEFLAYQASRNEGSVATDTGVRSYEGGIVFLLSMRPDPPAGGSDAPANVAERERKLDESLAGLNFDVAGMLTAEYGDTVVPAVLAAAEGPSGGGGRNLTLLFPRAAGRWRPHDTLRVALDDGILGSGTHVFEFLTDDLINAPTLH